MKQLSNDSKFVRTHIFIRGYVQGIGFRWWIQKKAQGLHLVGWVRNLDDGGVEVVAEGKRDKVNKLIELVKKGSVFAKVENIDASWEEATGEFGGFEIAY